jgi:hypothetical protein
MRRKSVELTLRNSAMDGHLGCGIGAAGCSETLQVGLSRRASHGLSL